MAVAPLSKLAAARLEPLLPHLQAPAEAQGVLAGCPGVVEALAALEQAGLMLPAVRLLAHGLPRREGVWWACMCARHTAPADLAAADLAALEAAELWVRRPTDEHRRAAFAKAEAAGFATPEAWTAVAAFWAGDSMSPIGQPAVPPPPQAPGQAIAGAVILAAVRGDPTREADRLSAFLGSARDIAGGGTGRLDPETP